MSASPLPDSIWFSEIDDPAPIRALFAGKFGADPPRTGHHHVAWLQMADGAWRPACYAHVEAFGDIGLLGGACTDGAALRMLPEATRSLIADAGGLYRNLLPRIFASASNRFAAVFGYCGNARAWDVGIAAGFVATEHAHLRVYFTRPQHEVLQRALIAKAQAIGPF